MPKPKTSPDLTPKPYRLLKTDLAAKLSARSNGGITYVLLADATDAPELHIAVTANEGGGLWSKEVVRLDTIETVLDAYAGQPFPTKALRGAVVGRSSNNPPFCLAVLKDLGLVAPAPEKAHQHVKAGDWQAFRTEWLSKPGEPVIYPEPKADGVHVAEAANIVTSAEPAPEQTGKGKKRKKVAVELPTDTTPVTNDVTTPELTDIQDAEGAQIPDGDVLLSVEAEHAPPVHA